MGNICCSYFNIFNEMKDISEDQISLDDIIKNYNKTKKVNNENNENNENNKNNKNNENNEKSEKSEKNENNENNEKSEKNENNEKSKVKDEIDIYDIPIELNNDYNQIKLYPSLQRKNCIYKLNN